MTPGTFDWKEIEGAKPDSPRLVELLKSLKDYGGFFLENSPVQKAAIHSVAAANRDVFSLSHEEKIQWQSTDGTSRTGYVPFAVEISDPGAQPDPKEIWHISRESAIPNIWPQKIPAFRSSVENLWSTLDPFAEKLMAVTGRALGCEDYCQSIMRGHNSILRMIQYRSDTPEKYGHELAGSHRDVGLLTIHLLNSHSGYETQVNDQWSPLEFQASKIFIAAGDMMTHISNGHIYSAPHRVRHAFHPEPRQFIGFFIHPHFDAPLIAHPKPGEPVRFPTQPNLDLLNRRASAIKISQY